MSDLLKGIKKPLASSPASSFARPTPFSIIPTVAEEGPDEDSSSASSVSSTGTVVPTNEHPRTKAPETSWHDFFEQELYLNLDDVDCRAKYHVYLTPPADPAKDPLFICHHGAGSAALSFAFFTRHLRTKLPKAGILAINAREHGSIVYSASEPDFSPSLLAQDLLNMIKLTKTKLGWSSLPTIVLVGHSLGGAVVAAVAKNGSLGSSLLGYAVIDVVEGSAMEALKNMQLHLSSRPTSFASLDAAIGWQNRSRTVRNIESARVSTPPLLRMTDTGSWVWITDLAKTQPFWESWFTGLSSNFLNGKGAKLLILAGTDRLDKELMIGQMQGKFQLQVFPEAGHFVQEDCPEKTADVIVEFFTRNDRSTMVLPPKVGDLLKQGKKV